MDSLGTPLRLSETITRIRIGSASSSRRRQSLLWQMGASQRLTFVVPIAGSVFVAFWMISSPAFVGLFDTGIRHSGENVLTLDHSFSPKPQCRSIYTPWFLNAVSSGDMSVLVDNEGQQLVLMNITLDSGAQCEVPIERLYKNLRTFKFEKLLEEFPRDAADVAGISAMSQHIWGTENVATRNYTVHLPQFVEVPSSQRRIWIDLGAGTWDANGNMGKISNFRQHFAHTYPKATQPWGAAGFNELLEIDFVPKKPPVKQKLDYGDDVNATFMNRRVVSWDKGDPRGSTEHDFNLNSYLLHNYRRSDFVVVKMDIENFEWPVLDDMEKSGAIDLVDELILEVHFLTDDPRWAGFIKRASLAKLVANQGGQHSREEALQLLQHLRDRGIYAHTYP